MKNSCVFAVAAMAFLSACTQEELQVSPTVTPSNGRHHITLNVNGVGEETRAVFAKSNSDFYWQTNDVIGVLAGEAETFFPLGLESRTANMKSATFAGEIEGDLGGYAVYPYNENHKYSGGTLTYHLPSEYTYANWDKDFVASSDKVDENKKSACPALLAKIDAEKASAQFTHLGGLLCIRIDQMPATKCFFTVTADRQICGDFPVKNLSYTDPTIVSEEDNTEVPESLKTVTINTDGGTYNTSAVFYIPLPVGENYEVTVKLGYYSISGDENSSCTSTKTFSIGRKDIKIVNLTQSTMHKGGYKVVKGHKFVDLGLSKMWAETNLGATVSADCGDMYAWGETKTKDGYTVNNYTDWKWADEAAGKGYCSKYQEKRKTLEDADDAAYNVWGSFCRMPTKGEVEELVSKSDVESVECKNSKGETVSGLKLTSTLNGNSIFFPCTGSDNNGRYWTSTSGDFEKELSEIFGITLTSTFYNAYCFGFNGGGTNMGIDETHRASGYCVRPVLK